jgi:hypothetical protein
LGRADPWQPRRGLEGVHTDMTSNDAGEPTLSVDFARIVDSRRNAEAISGLHFSLWIGDSDEEPRSHAERLHAALSRPDHSVYVVCNVHQRTLEIVTGAAARQTLTDEECVLATGSMRQVLATGNITDALVQGLDHLGTYALD